MSVRKKKGGRTTELTAKPPETAVERSIVVMDSILQLGVCEGEAGKHIILDYADAKHAGYITITPERGLELVEAAVPALAHRLVPFALPVGSQRAGRSCSLGILRHDRAAIAERAEVLRRIEAECGRLAEAPGATAP